MKMMKSEKQVDYGQENISLNFGRLKLGIAYLLLDINDIVAQVCAIPSAFWYGFLFFIA